MTLTTIRSLYPVQISYHIARQAGTSVYIVGGTVRDRILGNASSNDCDFTVDSNLHDFTLAFAEKVRGKVIPWDTDQIRVVYRHNDISMTVDFTVIKQSDIIYDLTQRDFTINAMAVNLSDLFEMDNPVIIDPCNGRDDIERRIIKRCSSTSFDADPLRLLRAIRLGSELSCTIDSDTLQDMCMKAYLLGKVSRERVKRELFMILGLPNAHESILQLCETGLVRQLLPELDKYHAVQQPSPHEYNLFMHVLKTVQNIDAIIRDDYVILEPYRAHVREYFKDNIEEGVTRRALLVFTGLLHDSGKYGTGKNDAGRITFYGHEKEGESCNRAIAHRLGLGHTAQRIVGQITRHHMRILHICLQDTVTERARIRLIQDINEVFWEIIILALADAMATSSDPVYLKLVDKINVLGVELARWREDPLFKEKKKPLLNGFDVKELLGIRDGQRVGRILAELHEQEMAGIVNTRDEAIKWITTKKEQP